MGKHLQARRIGNIRAVTESPPLIMQRPGLAHIGIDLLKNTADRQRGKLNVIQGPPLYTVRSGLRRPGARKKMISTLRKILESEDFPEGSAWRMRKFKAQQIIVRAGEQDGHLYLVVTGELRVTGQVEIDDARRVHPGICDLGPGDVFGELCLFDMEPRSATVEGMKQGQLIEIDADCLNQWMDRHPATGLKALRELYGELISRLRKANQRVESLFAWGLRVHGIDRHI